MSDETNNITQPAEAAEAVVPPAVQPQPAANDDAAARAAEINDRFVRLYAEFENYKKRSARDREDLLKYANESIMRDLLATMDTFDMALKHLPADQQGADNSFVQGIVNTQRELQRTLEKYGLKLIEAAGKPFDPAFHEAIAQAERADVDDMTVVEEYRKGYTYRDKVIRASMVVVSRKPSTDTTQNS